MGVKIKKGPVRRRAPFRQEVLVRTKPWEFRGRRMERNAPQGYRCDGTCTHKTPAQGTKTCLCTVCHEMFSTPANFDRHRRDGWCVLPSACGLRMGENGSWIAEVPPGRLNRFSGRAGVEEDDE